MKRFCLLFVNLLIVSGFIFTSCSNSDEEAQDPNSANLKTEKYSLSNCPDSLDVSELFNGYNGKSSVSCPLKPSDSAPLC